MTVRQFRPQYLSRVPADADPLVKDLFHIMLREHCTLSDLAERSGVNRNTISAWANRQVPSVANFEACLNALGYELVIKPCSEGKL